MTSWQEEDFKSHFIQGQNGDNAAYEVFLDHCSTLLQSYYSKRVFTQRDCDDILQEALIAIHKSRHTYHHSRPFFPWIFAIAKYKLTDYIRRQKSTISLDCHESISQSLAANEPETSHDTHDILYKALARLPVKTREIIRLNKLEGYPFKKIADHFGMSVVAVKTAASRGYKKLEKYVTELERNYDNDDSER